MAEKWRRCERCRKVKGIEEFTGDQGSCQACSEPARSSRSHGSRAVASATVVVGTPLHDLRGRGDPEVRARRARTRALDRLAQLYPDDFEHLLGEERRAEGL